MKNFLSGKVHSIFIATLIFSFFIGLWMIFGVAILIYAGALYLFRKTKNHLFQDDFINTINVLSPVSGKAQKVEEGIDHPLFGKNLNAITFRVNFFDEYGIYLPASTEVKDVRTEKIKEVNRFKDYSINDEEFQNNGTLIQLKSKMDEIMGLQVLKGIFSMRPRVVVLPGDRGRARANIGVLPFGGLIVLYFDHNYKTHIKEGDDVDAGKTIIASSREGSE